jgi:hypothetical protein
MKYERQPLLARGLGRRLPQCCCVAPVEIVAVERSDGSRHFMFRCCECSCVAVPSLPREMVKPETMAATPVVFSKRRARMVRETPGSWLDCTAYSLLELARRGVIERQGRGRYPAEGQCATVLRDYAQGGDRPQLGGAGEVCLPRQAIMAEHPPLRAKKGPFARNRITGAPHAENPLKMRYFILLHHKRRKQWQ